MKKFILFIILAAFGLCKADAQLFFEISGNGLEKPSYIFGTHHLAPLSVLDDYGIIDRLQDVDKVVGEVDMTEEFGMSPGMLKFIVAPSDSTLSKVLSPEDYAFAAEEFKKYSPMPLATFESMRPMMVTTMIILNIMEKSLDGYDEDNQMDMFIMRKGVEMGKEVLGLETAEYQAELIYTGFSISEQAEALMELLRDPDVSFEEADSINEYYLTGDLEGLAELQKEDDSDFTAKLVDPRNADWLTKIPAIISDGPALFAVGALHLVGDNGVLQGLRDLGYDITPIYRKQSK